MDKTAQDSLAKKPVDMRDRILEHLEARPAGIGTILHEDTVLGIGDHAQIGQFTALGRV